MTFLLRAVLLDWEHGDTIVTTSLNQSPDFYCERVGAAPGAVVEALEIPGLSVNGHLVQMGVPEIFQHMPLLCTPLYHEVGHYIEEREGLIASLVVGHREALISAMPSLKQFGPAQHQHVLLNYAIEHFCDLVAASYVGECVSDYIIQWDHSTVANPTHPAAKDRAAVTRDYLAGTPNALVDLLKTALSESHLNTRLDVKFSLPALQDCFSDVRPVVVSSIAELHGILPAADAFLKQLRSDPDSFHGTKISRVASKQYAHLINDLIEKSIRNYMIAKAWDESLDKKANP